MHKETITYVDYNDEERSEDFYFNLNEGELMEMEMMQKGGLDEYITKIINERDQKKITKLFIKIIKKSYGVKTLDGGFDKDPAYFKKFKTTEAYSVLFTKLATDSEFAARFINGIIHVSKKPQDHKMSQAEEAKMKARERFEATHKDNVVSIAPNA